MTKDKKQNKNIEARIIEEMNTVDKIDNLLDDSVKQENLEKILENLNKSVELNQTDNLDNDTK